MIQIVKILNGEPVMLAEEKKLQVPDFSKVQGSEERALRCWQARNFKTELEKAQKREKRQDKIAEAIGDTVTGILLIAFITVALWLGSI